MGPESCARLFDLAAGVCPSSAAPLSPQSHLMESTPLHRNVSTTALGVMEYLDAYGLVLQEGTHCLVIGRHTQSAGDWVDAHVDGLWILVSP